MSSKASITSRGKGVVQVGRSVFKVANPKWCDHASCRGAPWSDFELESNGNVLYRAMKHCVTCLVRTDCVIAALSTRDTGMIRGGISFHEKMKHELCRKCRLPVADDKGICTYCSMLRKCVSCEVIFTARYTWVWATLCPSCNKEQKPPPKLTKYKKPCSSKLFRFRRRKK